MRAGLEAASVVPDSYHGANSFRRSHSKTPDRPGLFHATIAGPSKIFRAGVGATRVDCLHVMM
jgi:hypothetical protein